eukprot:CAMPEP_0181214514 /NCGR_PEP_ID=MMETSP1096-20121128/25500_1 /TAXON_ID=156174 ORGANISM="Chrysochromulina ericina, Strain CCMP281" /NCGR_SAMPLE_ID=MMETSP1096 /ASSEMBLY_ACC=CAM_ASM_000453 /LENGTH=79 /DNA_ID=CAMNT_0023306267 /DNA_START=349 /DNA_END=585 /DNA_ORIENTATION=-
MHSTSIPERRGARGSSYWDSGGQVLLGSGKDQHLLEYSDSSCRLDQDAAIRKDIGEKKNGISPRCLEARQLVPTAPSMP